MPFITGEARRMTDAIGPKEVGDKCFLFYREMLRAWRASPRWTTAHELYVNMQKCQYNPLVEDSANNIAAHQLAWQVFFQLHVMPYEMQKRTLNGEIDY